MTLQVGGHGDQVDPIAEAAARKATLAQFFLGDPQAWKGPEIRYAGGAAKLKAAAQDAGIRLYVHGLQEHIHKGSVHPGDPPDRRLLPLDDLGNAR